MKKFFLMFAIAGALVACDNSASKTEGGDSTGTTGSDSITATPVTPTPGGDSITVNAGDSASTGSTTTPTADTTHK